MATAIGSLSLEDYLRTSYHPDCDFVDGQIEERILGEFEHARVQTLLAMWFCSHERDWSVITLVEQRIRVAPTRVRIADICLIRRDAPREQVTVTPPLLCVEVLSPEDRLARAARVMDDYARMGVLNLWLLDPLDRVGYVYSGGGGFQLTNQRLSVPEREIHIDLPSLFASLD